MSDTISHDLAEWLEKTEQTQADLNKKIDDIQHQRQLEKTVESKVNKAWVKNVWQQWATLIVLIGIISLTAFFSDSNFKTLHSEFKNLQEQVKSTDKKIQEQIKTIDQDLQVLIKKASL